MTIQATPWKKYQYNRTYYTDTMVDPVTLEEVVVKLGWVDEKTGTLTEESEGGEVLIRAWLAQQAGEPIVAPVSQEQPALVSVNEPDNEPAYDPPTAGREAWDATVNEVTPAPTPPTLTEPEWTDLALNRPGQAARAKAQEELALRKEKAGKFWTVVGKALDTKTDERAWRIGADAEETIGRELENLTKYGWYVLHSIPVGNKGSDIDHLVLGPGGIVTCNAKHHPNQNIWVVKNQVRVSNNAQPYLRNSRFEADRAAKMLGKHVDFPIPVISALIFRLGDGTITVKEDPEDVLILRAGKAWERIRDRMPVVLDQSQVDALYAFARRSTTWTTK